MNGKTQAKALLAGLVIVAMAFLYFRGVGASMKTMESWMSTQVTPEEINAMETWVMQNTNERTIFYTDIFGGEMMMGKTLREGVEGGDWAVIPNVVDRMGDADKFFKSTDSKEAHDLAKKYSAEYVWLPNRQLFCGYGWFEAEKEKFNDQKYFEKVYDEKGVMVYKVK